MVQLLWKTAQKFLKKFTVELPYDPAIPPLGLLKSQNQDFKEILALLHSLETTVTKMWKQPDFAHRQMNG